MENHCQGEPLPLPRRAKGFLIKAELKMTPDNKGIGVFAAQFIPANTRIDDPKYLYYDEQETLKHLASLANDEARRYWLDHAFGLNGKLVSYDESVDDGGMVNHSDNPTMADREDGFAYTTRDVHEGEELTEDYGTYEDLPFYDRLCEKYGISDWYVKNPNNIKTSKD